MTHAVKLAIIYYSSTGTVDAMAAARRGGGEARRRGAAATRRGARAGRGGRDDEAWSPLPRSGRADRVTADDVVWADAVLFGTPTRFGNVASQLKQFIDTLGPQWGEGALADKVYAGFTAAETAHGGHESTLLALYNTVHHFGGIVVTPGYTDPMKFEDGNPYGVSHGHRR